VLWVNYVISTQSLAKFANVAIKKLGLKPLEIRAIIDAYSKLDTVQVGVELVKKAVGIRFEYGIGFYDALIVAAAEEGGCVVLYSEDLSAGQFFRGVRVVDTFG